MYPMACYVKSGFFWVNLLRWPLSEETQGQMHKKDNKGREGWQYTFTQLGIVSRFLVQGLKGHCQLKSLLHSSNAFGTDKLYCTTDVKFIWTWSQNNSFLLQPWGRSVRGSSDYGGALLSTSPQGWLTLSGAWSWTPAPSPCQRLQSCVCLKTRLNPSQQLSQIRSQLREAGDALKAAGADCRADLAITESMGMLRVKESDIERPVLERWYVSWERKRENVGVYSFYIDLVMII